MTSKRSKFPPLLRLSNNEAQCIANMFRLYDINCSGKIPNASAEKLARALGVKGVDRSNFSSEVGLNELLLTFDQFMPEPEPALLSSLTTFNNLEAIPTDEGMVITPDTIARFMEKLGRPPALISEASLMLNAMLEYDDCSETPIVSAQTFAKELINFAKKHNAFRDYRGGSNA